MNDLQGAAAAMLDTIEAVEDEKRSKRLAPEDRALIIQLLAKGTMTQEAIASAVGCHQSSVSRIAATLDTRAAARAILESGAAKMAANVVENSDPDLHLKALGKLDVVRDDKEANHGSGVTVIVGMPGASVQLPDMTGIVIPPATARTA